LRAQPIVTIATVRDMQAMLQVYLKVRRTS
jgi:hypothetical protein